MASTYSIKDCLLGKVPANTEITLQGWVKTRRDSKAGFSFIALHDGSCFAPIQLVAENTLSNYHEEILKLTASCAIKIVGILVPSPAKGQDFEVHINQLQVIGWVENPETYPIQPKRHSLEFLREVAHLRPRTNTVGAITRVRHALSQAVHQFFHQRGYFWIHTPIITASDCEGAGELFRVSTLDLLNLPRDDNNHIDFKQDFFGQETFLTVSGQLNVEAYCLAMSKVYTFGPAFRAENSNTSRHLAEFWMIEPEIAFADLDTICSLSQDLLQHVCRSVLNDCADDMQFFNQFVSPGCMERVQHVAESEFARMTYTEAVETLTRCNKSFDFPVRWGLDLQSEHERYLAEEFCQRPVIITHYPKDIKSFYMRLNENGKTVAAMDVLAPGIGEIIGGSQREERIEILSARMAECHLNQEKYQWYQDLRRYGSVPHAGFGLGFERLVSYVTGVSNIRDVIPFPRTPGRADY